MFPSLSLSFLENARQQSFDFGLRTAGTPVPHTLLQEQFHDSCPKVSLWQALNISTALKSCHVEKEGLSQAQNPDAGTEVKEDPIQVPDYSVMRVDA
ncbi:hypothetical protein CERZMDRAFT_95674 [Cercospora zeae-maydis SCOH1-5]|uniref:Uncharacterized protein n=1 Tax=Cercospora zeae-maydis SCOH1-5 TaxID=717836 RepID=A0A6A6FM80_9PEZI|nr:hypothetical protein CERZMDRAFT_95674 [Cercospora zeae-maydis SCOH1-5]